MLGRFPVTSSNRHFIFCDTSYQREKWSLHTRYFTLVHYIPCGTSYQSHFIPVHFIRLSSYQGHSIPVTSYYASLHTEATSYQCISSRGHFISVHFKPKSPHTQVTSYRGHFILVISCRSFKNILLEKTRSWWKIYGLELKLYGPILTGPFRTGGPSNHAYNLKIRIEVTYK